MALMNLPQKKLRLTAKEIISLKTLVNLDDRQHKGLQRIICKQLREKRKTQVIEYLQKNRTLEDIRIFTSGQGWEASAFLDVIPTNRDFQFTTSPLTHYQNESKHYHNYTQIKEVLVCTIIS